MLLNRYHPLDSPLVEAGIDEAGRGCLAGPVVCAAVILPANFHCEVLDDSKKMSAEARLLAREQIIAQAISYAIAYISPQRIDEINILQATFEGMHQAVNALTLQPDFLCIDGNRFRPHSIPHISIVKGDGKYQHIAAASVLAKTARDAYMATLHTEFPQYSWDSNKGYPTVAHRDAIVLYGVSPHHRRTFQLLPPLSLF